MDTRSREQAVRPGTVPIDDKDRVFSELALPEADCHIDTDRYFSPEFLKREIDRLWLRCWHTACRDDDLPEAGSWREHRVGDRSFVLVRGNDGRIRCFRNACLHRGNLLCQGEGRSGSLRCPYHAWTWRLEGTLARVTDRQFFNEIDDDRYRLPEVGCQVWGGFVMVNPTPDGTVPFDEFIGPVAGPLARYDLANHVAVGLNVEIDVASNWKTLQDAFLETYHLPFLHSQLIKFTNEMRTRLAVMGRHSLMVTPFAEASERGPKVSEQDVYDAYMGQMPVAARILMNAGTGSPGTGSPAGNGHGGGGDGGGGDGNERWTPSATPDGPSAKVMVAQVLREATEATGFDTGHFADDEVADVWQYFVFPNLLLSSHPGHVFCSWVLPHPDDPNRCTLRIENLRWTRPEQRASVRAPLGKMTGSNLSEKDGRRLGKAVEQDLVNLPRQQDGLRMGGLQQQTLSRHELRLAHFHRTIDEFLADG